MSAHESSEEILGDLEDAESRTAAERALNAIAEALEEDDPAPPDDPGLPVDYQVLGILGYGAGGVVYRAHQRSLDREVAVKVLASGVSARDAERLLGEARRLASLRHPSITRIHEAGRAGGGVYLTLEFHRGGSLQDALRSGPLNPMRAARAVQQVAEGIAFTHSHGVVHLDLKPGNVLLDEAGNAAVGDFGLAREVDALELSRSGAGLLGTPAFMAPEQAADQRALIGEQTDVYGLGALLYACVAGAAPFESTGLADTLQAVRFDEPEALMRRAPGTPQDLAAIVKKAMSKDPADRYASASSMTLDLARFIGGESVEARMPGPWKQLWRGLVRHRREIAGAAAVALLVAVSMLPHRRDSSQAGEAWLRAAKGLLQLDQPEAALEFIEDGPGVVRLDASQEKRARLLSEWALNLHPKGTETKEPSPGAGLAATARRLGLDERQWSWLAGHLGPERTWQLGFQVRSPFSADLMWRSWLGELAREPDLDEEDSAMVLELAGALPHWRWENGFAGWLEPAPVDAAEVVERLARGGESSLAGTTCEVLVQVIFVDSRGSVDEGEAWRGTDRGDDRLRFEGRGHASLDVPRDHFGMDLLRAAGPYMPRSKPGDWRCEVEGSLVPTQAGPFWKIHDLEPLIQVPGRSSAWFVDDAAKGLLAGDSGVLDVRVERWSGYGGAQWAATVVLGQVAAPGEDLPFGVTGKPSLEAWRALLGGRLDRWVKRHRDLQGRGASPTPVERAALLDAAMSLAVIGPAESDRATLDEAMDLSRKAAGSLSKGFAPSATYTATVGAGANLQTWLSMAGAVDPEGTGEVLDALPLPPSAQRASPRSMTGGLGWKAWVSLIYLLAALVFPWLAWREPSDSPRRLHYLAQGFLAAALCLDKTTLPQLGSLHMDAIGCAVLAATTLGTGRWGRRWSTFAALCFFIAALCYLIVPFVALVAPASPPLHGPLFDAAPRVPLMLGMAALVPLAQRLSPRNRYPRFWTSWALLFLVVASLLLIQPTGGTAGPLPFLAYMVLGWGIIARCYVAALARSG